MITIIRKGEVPALEEREYPCGDGIMLPVLVSPLLEKEEGVRHFFTTREGGVSEGIFRSLNLSFARGDDPGKVSENFKRTAAALGTTPDHMVLTHQTHTDNIRIVTQADAGKGVTVERDYNDVDGLITNVPGLALGAFIADCVPVLMADPVHRAVAAVHSGWRGTAAGISVKAIRMMHEEYGTDPKDLVCAVGPSICRSCYEVGEDVAVPFAEKFPNDRDRILTEKGGGKYLLDLWEANHLLLLKAGVPECRITVTDVCTACNKDVLFSHRASHGLRGNLGAFIMLEK